MPLNNGAVSEILQFGHGAGANVMAQPEYVADVARTAGNQSGLARSKFVNKIWRQGAHMAAGVAQWIANRYAPGVRDNGDLDAIEAGMTAAVQTCAAQSWPLMAVEWSSSETYSRRTLVIGGNGKLYVWLKASGPGVSGVGAKDPTVAGNAAWWLDYAASITPPAVEKYDLGEFYYFRHPTLRPGFQPAQGGLLANAATLYPEAWAYLQTTEGKKLCTTEAQWQAMTTATWATPADGSKVGWNGIGGAPYYAPNTATGALRLPDLRGMYAEAAGFDSLGVGGVHGDMIRNIVGVSSAFATYMQSGTSGAITSIIETSFAAQTAGAGASALRINLDPSRVVPTGSANKPRAWGALACVYLGQSAS